MKKMRLPYSADISTNYSRISSKKSRDYIIVREITIQGIDVEQMCYVKIPYKLMDGRT